MMEPLLIDNPELRDVPQDFTVAINAVEADKSLTASPSWMCR